MSPCHLLGLLEMEARICSRSHSADGNSGSLGSRADFVCKRSSVRFYSVSPISLISILSCGFCCHGVSTPSPHGVASPYTSQVPTLNLVPIPSSLRTNLSSNITALPCFTVCGMRLRISGRGLESPTAPPHLLRVLFLS